MDVKWNKPLPVSNGAVACILCKCVVLFPNKDKKKYFTHMQRDHGAFFNINLILIINLLERRQVLKMISSIKSGEDLEAQKKEVCDQEVQTDAVSAMEDTDSKFDEVQEEDGQNFKSIAEQLEQMQKMLAQNNAQEDMLQTSMSDSLISENSLDDTRTELDVIVPSDDEQEREIQSASPPAGPDDMEMEEYGKARESDNEITEISDNHEKDADTVEKKDKNVEEKNPRMEFDILLEFLVQKSEYFRQHPHQVTSCTQSRAERFTGVDPAWPRGWRYQAVDRGHLGNGRRDLTFLSPELTLFRSRVAVVEYMNTMGGYSEQEISRILPQRIKKERSQRD